MDDARNYENQGKNFLCGDFNSRVGLMPDFVEQTGLDRFVDLPDDDDPVTNVTVRTSKDKSVNMFGHKLISLCKELRLCLANGRLEPGRFTFQSSTGCSAVDYFVTKASNFKYISNMEVLDPCEFSDHCSLYISIFLLNVIMRKQKNLPINYFGIRKKQYHFLMF